MITVINAHSIQFIKKVSFLEGHGKVSPLTNAWWPLGIVEDKSLTIRTPKVVGDSSGYQMGLSILTSVSPSQVPESTVPVTWEGHAPCEPMNLRFARQNSETGGGGEWKEEKKEILGFSSRQRCHFRLLRAQREHGFHNDTTEWEVGRAERTYCGFWKCAVIFLPGRVYYNRLCCSWYLMYSFPVIDEGDAIYHLGAGLWSYFWRYSWSFWNML